MTTICCFFVHKVLPFVLNVFKLKIFFIIHDKLTTPAFSTSLKNLWKLYLLNNTHLLLFSDSTLFISGCFHMKALYNITLCRSYISYQSSTRIKQRLRFHIFAANLLWCHVLKTCNQLCLQVFLVSTGASYSCISNSSIKLFLLFYYCLVAYKLYLYNISWILYFVSIVFSRCYYLRLF